MRSNPFAHWGAPVCQLLLALGLTGCDAVEPVAVAIPSNDPAFYAGLEMNHHAVTLSTVAPYDTVQLTARPVDLVGNPLTNLPAPIIFSPDTAAVSVTSDGLVRARKVATNIRVIARLDLAGNLAHADTTFIDITDLASPPRMASISTFPAGDSAVLGEAILSGIIAEIAGEFRQEINNNGFSMDFTPMFYSPDLFRSYTYDNYPAPPIRVLDSLGNSMTGLRVEVRALDPKVADFFPGGVNGRVGSLIFINPVKAGQARVEARTTAYGITMADTVTWKITPPPLATIHFIPRPDGTLEFIPNTVRIRTSGVVSWLNWATDTTEVIFDDPTNVAMPTADICQAFLDGVGFSYSDGLHCGAGNVVLPARVGPFPDPSYTPIWQVIWYNQLRQFSVAGTYRFRDPRTGKTGEIVVSE